MQLYASSSNYAPPYPEAGFTFLDGMINYIFLFLSLTSFFTGAVEAITSTMGDDWDYGAYVNYPDDRLNSGTSAISLLLFKG